MKKSHTQMLAIVALVAVLGTILTAFASAISHGDNTGEHPERIAVHYHVLIEGIHIPANIGINDDLWHDRSLDYLGANGMAPIHTHDTRGVLHIESKERYSFTLQDFFDIWGYTPASMCIVTVADLCSQLENYDVVMRDGDVYRVN